MIEEIKTPQHTTFIQTICNNTSGLGVNMDVCWQLKLQNPSVPWQFYKVGENSFFFVNGDDATLCGTPDEPEEFLSFVSLARTKRITSDGFCPQNWQTEPLNIMGYNAIKTNYSSPIQIDKEPPMQQVIALLSAQNPRPIAQQEYLYFNGCLRRNHNMAAIWGIFQQEKLVSTASFFALTKTHAMLSCVETDPTFQKKGYASALIQSLCNEYAPRKVELFCTDEMIPFYQNLHFTTCGTIYISFPPQ